MKISAYHKQQGNTVEWVNYFEKYDKVYISKIFTFTPDIQTVIQADEIIRGGTGYDVTVKLPLSIDECEPDYSLYPKFKQAIGFITRGCVRKCPWCVVPKKEGNIRFYNDIEYILGNRKSAVLLDGNFLSHSDCKDMLHEIIQIGCKVDFNQGLDAFLR